MPDGKQWAALVRAFCLRYQWDNTIQEVQLEKQNVQFSVLRDWILQLWTVGILSVVLTLVQWTAERCMITYLLCHPFTWNQQILVCVSCFATFCTYLRWICRSEFNIDCAHLANRNTVIQQRFSFFAVLFCCSPLPLHQLTCHSNEWEGERKLNMGYFPSNSLFV